MNMMRKNRELQYPPNCIGSPGSIQRRLEMGCCPKCWCHMKGSNHCSNCNLTIGESREVPKVQSKDGGL